MIIASYATLINSKIVSDSPRPQYLVVEKHFFQSCLRSVIENIPLNEAWYLETYPDVRDGIAKKIIASARQHYLNYGFREPSPVSNCC